MDQLQTQESQAIDGELEVTAPPNPAQVQQCSELSVPTGLSEDDEAAQEREIDIRTLVGIGLILVALLVVLSAVRYRIS